MSVFSQKLLALYQNAPNQIALTLQKAGQADAPMTRAQLLQGAQGFAQTLAEKNVQPGEVVLLILQHGEALVYAYFGAVLHGAVPSIMPFLTEKLSPERYRADLSALLSITKPAAIVTYAEFAGDVNAALQADSSVRTLILAEAIAPRAIDASLWPGLARQPDDVALLQHSSGTTGLQKGVALSHRAVFNQLNSYAQTLKLNEKDVIVSWLPLYHDMGLIAGFLLPLLCGAPLILMSPFDWVRAPYRLFQSVSQYQGTLTWLPNFAYNFCAQKIRDRHLEGVDLSSWRAVINCSEPVRHASHAAFYQKFKPYGLRENSLHTCYAMAENVFAVTQSNLAGQPRVERCEREALMNERIVRESAAENAITVMSSGAPLPNVEIKIVDEQGSDLPERLVGEILLKSDCMLSGYYNRPDATQQAFRDGWYLTGDYGFLSAGELFVIGRKKDLMIIGGKNVYPQDLEALTYEVAGVHAGRSVAFGVFDEEQGTEEAALIVEVDSEDEAEQQKIADLIRQHVTKNSAIALRHVKVVGPQWVIKTSSGKTARAANKEKFLLELKNNSR
ncbi:MAG: AMP-binding protein [Anaerolineales bacterium]|nr:AMP-binding protein [Anaerolineales bacterium]